MTAVATVRVGIDAISVSIDVYARTMRIVAAVERGPRLDAARERGSGPGTGVPG